MIDIYLSRLTLDPAGAAGRDLDNVYQLHRAVMRGFPATLPADERVLFRLDEDRDGRVTLLVQSRTAPAWSALPSGYLLPSDPFDPLPNPAVKRVSLAFHPGQWLRFRLRANPTLKQPRPGRNQGRRVAIAGDEARLAWLARKGTVGGFRPLDEVNVADQGQVSGHGQKRPKPTPPAELDERCIKLHLVQFDGLLEVTDPARFAQTLLAGIGSAKGFGCGLLSLAAA